MNFKIDNLQYCNWSREIFEFNREANLDAVHVTIVYHEDFDELVGETRKWEKLFSENSDLIFLGNDFKDIEKANVEKKKQSRRARERASLRKTSVLSFVSLHPPFPSIFSHRPLLRVRNYFSVRPSLCP